jgi:meckelin
VYTECVICTHFAQKLEQIGTEWVCSCPQDDYEDSGDTCVLRTDTTAFANLGTVNPITYNRVEKEGASAFSSAVMNSELMDYYYFTAAVGCNAYDLQQQCQVLANLCVMHMYNERHPTCALFQTIMAAKDGVADASYSDEGWKMELPWLYYEREPDDIINDPKLQMTVSFNSDPEAGAVNMLEYWVAKYTVDGTFLGFEELNDQLFLCPTTSATFGKNFRQFGTNFQNSCLYDLSNLLTEEDTIFYELFLKDSDGTFWDVPVKIVNFVDSKTN